MQYLGGKVVDGERIANLIEHWRSSGSRFVDAFCGSLNVCRHIRGTRVANDACTPLVTLLLAVQKGWEPPRQILQSHYDAIKAIPDAENPLTAFVMFGLSFGGKWGAGMNRGSDSDWQSQLGYTVNIFKRLQEKVADCKDVPISNCDYRQLDIFAEDTVYADIPYEGTTEYAWAPRFSSPEFWRTANGWVANGAKVFVSESDKARPSPEWVVLDRWGRTVWLGSKSRIREERIYVHRMSPMGRVVEAKRRARVRGIEWPE